ncbi:MAG: hypothetical protein R2733_09705 [Acidimicrobiales bacterium]
MTMMDLGLPIVSPSRLPMRRLAVFAAWEDEVAVDRFLGQPGLGSVLADGWHVRLELLRRWGHVSGFDERPGDASVDDPDQPVVAVTLAHLQLTQFPRFVRWGKPVEELVRDDPASTLAVAAMRPLRTLATFSVWTSQRAMVDMVGGHREVPEPTRHVDAMGEQRRKDFHHEFVALRFRPLGEYGTWDGRSDYVPTT